MHNHNWIYEQADRHSDKSKEASNLPESVHLAKE